MDVDAHAVEGGLFESLGLAVLEVVIVEGVVDVVALEEGGVGGIVCMSVRIV